MTWLWVAVVVAVLGVVIAVAVGRISGGAMPEVAPDRPAAQLSAEPLTDADLAGIRFTQTLRGYAMDEVDDFIERLRSELAQRPRLDAYPAPTAPTASDPASDTGQAQPVPVVEAEPTQPDDEPTNVPATEPLSVDGDPRRL